MLILTEKPSVAKDFAAALGCRFSPSEKCYRSSDGKTVIANCVGHLFTLAEPQSYSPLFKSWRNLPVIPEPFVYEPTPALKDTAARVVALLKKHRNDGILIATDADREGEVIARECLNAAGITDLSGIRRFWVSQALTKSVILEGIKSARPLPQYDALAEQGFARQKADWLVGINATRYVTGRASAVLPVGRVQTAVLAEIAGRCAEISGFRSERYYEFEGLFEIPGEQTEIRAVFVTDGNARFKEASAIHKLDALCGRMAHIADARRERRTVFPPQLYSLNDLQKEAFSYFGYPAEKTLAIVQKLYETYKCVSYPRTPSRVMGSGNVELCRDIYQQMLKDHAKYAGLRSAAKIDTGDRRVFDDTKLEAHHALIPLAGLPASATVEEDAVYSLILERFMLAFAPVGETESITARLSVGDAVFEARGMAVISAGWKQYRQFTKDLEQKPSGNEQQDLGGIGSTALVLKSVNAKEKSTRPPKHYNEASLLAFMENPKHDGTKKLAGLGTAATRHTFIPKLKKAKFITEENKCLLITRSGERLLSLLEKTPFRSIADISETTRWEEELAENPAKFLADITAYIRESVCGDMA